MKTTPEQEVIVQVPCTDCGRLKDDWIEDTPTLCLDCYFTAFNKKRCAARQRYQLARATKANQMRREVLVQCLCCGGKVRPWWADVARSFDRRPHLRAYGRAFMRCDDCVGYPEPGMTTLIPGRSLDDLPRPPR